MRSRYVLVAFVAAAAVLAPAAAAAHPHHHAKHAGAKHALNLPIVPLQQAELGSFGSALALQQDSGPVSNLLAALKSGTFSPSKLKHLGRVTGYTLDYGYPYEGGAGVHQIETSADEYRNSAETKRALVFWKKQLLVNGNLNEFGVTDSAAAVKLPSVGQGHWAYLWTIGAPAAAPVYVVNEEVREDRYVLDLTVSAGTASTAEGVASKLARKLDHKVQLGLAGKLHGKPVTLPKPVAPGPPAGGPDPQAATLTTSDIFGSTIVGEGYSSNHSALSEYDLAMQPAGLYDDLFQSVVVTDSSTAATYLSDIAVASDAAFVTQNTGGTGQATQVDLSAIGDNAIGAVIHVEDGINSFSEAVIGLSSGSVADLVFVDTANTISADQVQQLAQTVASKLNAALAG